MYVDFFAPCQKVTWFKSICQIVCHKFGRPVQSSDIYTYENNFTKNCEKTVCFEIVIAYEW